MPKLSITLGQEQPEDALTIEKLHERAFGPGRYARTAFRMREGVPLRADLSFVARIGSMLVGSNRLTDIRIGAQPALLLGPLTVEPAFRSHGVGMALMTASLDAAKAAGEKLVILVGDEPYYRRAGFVHVPPGRIELPGPVDPKRLLICELLPGAFDGVTGATGRR